MEYNIYVDKVFGLLILMNLGFVFSYKIWFRCTATYRKCICLAIITSLCQTLLLLLKIGSIRFRFASGAVLSCVCVPYGLIYPKNSVLKDVAFQHMPKAMLESFFVSSCLYYVIFYQILIKQNGKVTTYMKQFLITIGVCITILSILYFERKAKERKESICSVRIVYQDKKIEMKALIDTGNHLFDAMTHKPVSIVTSEMADLLLSVLHNKEYHLISYRSIGCEMGWIRVYSVPNMYIETEHGDILCNNAMIAISETNFGKTNTYQMILHPQMIREE